MPFVPGAAISGLTLLLVLLSLPIFATSDLADFSERKRLEISQVTPSGEDMAAGTEIVIQFNRPVVPVGRMERTAAEIPVDIIPKLDCQWRWITTSALACILDQNDKLRETTEYTVTIEPGIRAEDGATIDQAYTHRFITQRPQVRHTWFDTWLDPGTPAVVLWFNQPVSRSSVRASIMFVYSESADNQVSATRAVKVEKAPNTREKPHYITGPGESYVLDDDAEETPEQTQSDRHEDDITKETKGEEARRVWLILPEKALPAATRVVLKVTPGLVSALGKQTGVEDRTLVSFDTFREFEFLGVTCADNDGKDIFITNTNKPGKCNPQSHIKLTFSAPVLNSQIKQHLIIQPDLAGGRQDYDPWANRRDYSRLGNTDKNHHYQVSLPDLLLPAQTYTLKSRKTYAALINKILPQFLQIETLQDEFGRHLKKPVDLSFATDHRPPAFRLKYHTAVLEKNISSDVPLYVTNLDSASFKYNKLTVDGLEEGQLLQLENIVKAQDIQYTIPMQIRDMLDNKSGVVYGTLDTEPDIQTYRGQRALFAMVSPFQAHVKVGHYNSLVWVTDLTTGEPVGDAQVQIYKDKLNTFSAEPLALSKSMTDASGLALLPGIKKLDPELNFSGRNCYSRGKDCELLYIRIEKAGEMMLMPLQYQFELNVFRASNYTVWSRTEKQYGHIHAWGMTAQGVYRAGDTMQYKFYIRDQNNDTYVPAPQNTYKLELLDPAGKTVHEITDITLSEFGSYSGEYPIPANAAMGWYQFKLTGDFSTDYSWFPLRVLVTDFVPSPFKVDNTINGDLFRAGDEIEVTSNARLHSGGPYTDAETRVSVALEAAFFSPTHPVAKRFRFDSYKETWWKTVFQSIDDSGDEGEIQHRFRLPAEDIVYGRLTAESAVRDDRGKYITARSSADYFGVDRLVGLHYKWLYQQGQPGGIDYLVVDQHGEPVSGHQVSIEIERQQIKKAKVKAAGNAYLDNYIEEWLAESTCNGTSKTEASVCTFTPEYSGIYRITATVTDTQGQSHSTTGWACVTGSSRVVWREPSDNSLTIIPEKDEYRLGEQARYLVKNPYPGAKALISIERYGVLKAWTQELEGSAPVIEIDMEKNLAPGFYLSVLVVSPRVETPPPGLGELDLGKPTFKIGYVSTSVVDPNKQVMVSISTDTEVYKPRDTVNATIQTAFKHGSDTEDVEIAAVVLDEAVLDLIEDGKAYFDPYKGFNKLDGLDLRNYNLLTRLIGRQKFAQKGANPGGGGGATISLRSLFKYVSYWNPSLKPDDNGQATIKFKLPDNLTGWRILALAVTPTDRMGLGDTGIKVNRPTEIRPLMPNQVTEGDTFQAGFSVMNRSDQTRQIGVTLSVDGPIQSPATSKQSLSLAPYKRASVYIPVTTSRLATGEQAKPDSVQFTATATDNLDADRIQHKLPVYRKRSLKTVAQHGVTDGQSVSQTLHIPDGIHTDTGAVSATLSPTLIGNLEGAFRYMRDYPYNCWEQILSKGVMASYYQQLQGYLPDTLEWETSQALPEKTLKLAADYQADNGGMAYHKPLDQYVCPYLSAYTALAFNWLREHNQPAPEVVEAKLHAYLERLLRRDIFPTNYSRSVVSTVRAMALAALSEHGKVSLQDLQRYRSHVQLMDLFGQAHYMKAALSLPDGAELAREINAEILKKANYSAGRLSFPEDLPYPFLDILSSPLRTNCVLMSAMTKYAGINTDRSFDQTPADLVSFVTQSRGNRAHWENTQDNMFCMKGILDYAQIYENVKPDIQVTVSLDEETLGNTVFDDLRLPATTLGRPINSSDTGARRKMNISRQGAGRLYYTARLSYAEQQALTQRVNAGIDIRKEYSVNRDDKWVLLNSPYELKQGELVRVDIYLSLPATRRFVVVDDPVPGGLEPLNLDLATTSIIDAGQYNFEPADGAWWFTFDDWRSFNTSQLSFYHKEVRHDAVRFYSDRLPTGNYHLSYMSQAIAQGEFRLAPVHAEEMYHPEVFGKGMSGNINIGK